MPEEMKRPNYGPWLLGAVLAICATVLVMTGHEEAVGKALAVAFMLFFFWFICQML